MLFLESEENSKGELVVKDLKVELLGESAHFNTIKLEHRFDIFLIVVLRGNFDSGVHNLFG